MESRELFAHQYWLLPNRYLQLTQVSCYLPRYQMGTSSQHIQNQAPDSLLNTCNPPQPVEPFSANGSYTIQLLQPKAWDSSLLSYILIQYDNKSAGCDFEAYPKVNFLPCLLILLWYKPPSPLDWLFSPLMDRPAPSLLSSSVFLESQIMAFSACTPEMTLHDSAESLQHGF